MNIDECPLCHGRGYRGDAPKSCDGCNGTGSLTPTEDRECGSCGGRGYVPDESGSRTCRDCEGEGFIVVPLRG